MNAPEPAPRKTNIFQKFLLFVAAADENLLNKCHDRDWQDVFGCASLAIGLWCYQVAVFTMVAVVAIGGGHFQLSYLLGAVFLASFVLLCDSHLVIRPSWYYRGVQTLKSVGVDISGGVGARAKNAVLLTIRGVFGLGLAQLTAIFLSLLLFKPDVDAYLDRVYASQNGVQIERVQSQVEAEIQRTEGTVKSQETRVDDLNKQVGRLRQGLLDPAAANSAVIAAQKEVDELARAKIQRDLDLNSANTFASNELAGVRGAPGNSGRRGSGPVRTAAEERVRNAKAADDAAAQALADARLRLDAARQQVTAAVSGGGHDRAIRGQLSSLESELASANTQLAASRDRLNDLTATRGATVQAAVATDPASVRRDDGLLGRLHALEEVAKDPKIAATIIIIDVTAFLLEMGAMLGSAFSLCPTTYALLLVKEAYESATRIADEIVKKTGLDDDTDPDPSASGAPLAPLPGDDGGDEQSPLNGLVDVSGFAKRGRGRPPKQPPAA